MRRDYTLFIKDILEAMGRIAEFVGEMSFAELLADDKTKRRREEAGGHPHGGL